MWPITRSIAFRRFQLLFHLRRQPPLATADQDLRRFQLVTTVAAINKSPLDRLPGDPLHLGDCTGLGVAVAGIARLGLHAHDTVVAVGHRSTCNGHLDPKLELLVRLAFADAFHLGCVQAVELVLVLPLLAQQTPGQVKLCRKRSLQIGSPTDFPNNISIHPAQENLQSPDLTPRPFRLAGMKIPVGLRVRGPSRLQFCRSRTPYFPASRTSRSRLRLNWRASVG